MSSPHEVINPEALAPPVGFSHAVVAATGRTVYLGGQTAHDESGVITCTGIVEQFAQAARNVVTALAAAGARPEHLVSLHIYVTDVENYRSALPALAAAYRDSFGKHYPAIALFEVGALFDPAAEVELVAIAVVPDRP
ncbi:MAG: RidA family protein [Actinomycetota bacterium]|nr:RidA family protein [Actinomycetota bacterium]